MGRPAARRRRPCVVQGPMSPAAGLRLGHRQVARFERVERGRRSGRIAGGEGAVGRARQHRARPRPRRRFLRRERIGVPGQFQRRLRIGGGNALAFGRGLDHGRGRRAAGVGRGDAVAARGGATRRVGDRQRGASPTVAPGGVDGEREASGRPRAAAMGSRAGRVRVVATRASVAGAGPEAGRGTTTSNASEGRERGAAAPPRPAPRMGAGGGDGRAVDDGRAGRVLGQRARATRCEKSAGSRASPWPRSTTLQTCQRSQQPASSRSCCRRRNRNRASSEASSPSIIADSCWRRWASILSMAMCGAGLYRVARSAGRSTSTSGRSSASMASRARKMRERTVPIGLPMRSAISS